MGPSWEHLGDQLWPSWGHRGGLEEGGRGWRGGGGGKDPSTPPPPRPLSSFLRQKAARGGFHQGVPKFLSPILGSFWGPKLAFLGLFLGSFFGPIFEHFLDHFWGYFGDHFGTRSAQEGAKMGPRGPPRASNTQNPAFAKTLKNHVFFKVFGVQRPPKRGS